MVKISNITEYTHGMQQSIEDKLWFLPFAKSSDSVKCIYDFGCADGSLMSAVHKSAPDLKLFGYDMDEGMIGIAENMCDFAELSNTPIFDLNDPCHTLLNASSVFHEIHSYGSEESIKRDYDAIFGIGAKYIAIRDMFYTMNMPKAAAMEDIVRVCNKASARMLDDFQNIHGSIGINKNMLHFLMKYRYVENWEREVRENYLPFSIEEFVSMIPKSYRIISVDMYTLPFLRERVMEDFSIDLKYPTHAKILLERK